MWKLNGIWGFILLRRKFLIRCQGRRRLRPEMISSTRATVKLQAQGQGSRWRKGKLENRGCVGYRNLRFGPWLSPTQLYKCLYGTVGLADIRRTTSERKSWNYLQISTSHQKVQSPPNRHHNVKMLRFMWACNGPIEDYAHCLRQHKLCRYLCIYRSL